MDVGRVQGGEVHQEAVAEDSRDRLFDRSPYAQQLRITPVGQVFC